MNVSLGSSAAVEDYLERILELMTKKGYARVVDIAASLHISQASVTNMLQRLDAEGFIKYEKYRGLILTEAGETLARAIAHRHELLTDFLTLLGVPPEVREPDIEGIEHHMSSSTLLAIESLTNELKKHPAILKKIKAAQNLSSKSTDPANKSVVPVLAPSSRSYKLSRSASATPRFSSASATVKTGSQKTRSKHGSDTLRSRE
jgi:Mn-dependent DtxR family transcriptional regulator